MSHAECSYCFDLSSERLCRIRLLREIASDRADASDYVLLVTMHHSVSDGWSLGIFFRELVSLYQAYVNGEDSPLAPLPIQYADYAQWQRRWLQGEVLERQVSYWREQLKGLPPLLRLPTDRPRPIEQSFPRSHGALCAAGLFDRAAAGVESRAGRDVVHDVAVGRSQCCWAGTRASRTWRWGRRSRTARGARPKG